MESTSIQNKSEHGFNRCPFCPSYEAKCLRVMVIEVTFTQTKTAIEKNTMKQKKRINIITAFARRCSHCKRLEQTAVMTSISLLRSHSISSIIFSNHIICREGSIKIQEKFCCLVDCNKGLFTGHSLFAVCLQCAVTLGGDAFFYGANCTLLHRVCV